MLCLLAKTMCGRIQLTMPRTDPEEGAGIRTPALWKITNSIGLYRNVQFDTSPGKSWTLVKCWTVLLYGISESYSLMIVFFEKAMITGVPLQKKLRAYKKKKKKKKRKKKKKKQTKKTKNVRAFFSQPGLDPPTHRQTRRKFPGSAHGYTLSWW